jgi:3-keto-L-gulonate-6-phosphate decarboxylase
MGSIRTLTTVFETRHADAIIVGRAITQAPKPGELAGKLRKFSSRLVL